MRLGVLLIAMAVCLTGCCGARQRLERKRQLFSLAIEYHWFASSGRSPNGIDEFVQFVTTRIENPDPYTSPDSDVIPSAVERLRQGELVFVWSADLTTHSDDSDPYVLGYEKISAAEGGFIVSGGGLVRQVSANEFAEIPKIPTVRQSDESDATAVEDFDPVK